MHATCDITDADARTCQADKREFAIKRFNLQGLDEDTIEDLRDEARTLQALSHPYIIRVYGIVETEQELCVICERATGKKACTPSIPLLTFDVQGGV